MRLKTKDLGIASHFLGADFLWAADGSLHLRQTKLIKSLLKETLMATCRSRSRPATPDVDLSIVDGAKADATFNIRTSLA